MTFIDASAPIAAHAAIATSVHGLLPNYEISDDLLHSHDAEESTGSGSFVKLKTITLSGLSPSPVTLRVKFDLKSSNTDDHVNGRIYKNGAGHGTNRDTGSATYVTFSEDLSFSLGDTLELWAQEDDLMANPIAYVKNLRVYGIERVLSTSAFIGVNS